MAWHKTGKDGDAAVDTEATRQQTAREEAKKKRFKRFWLPAGGETFITFLDESESAHGYEMPYVFMEHQLYLNGHWRNWFTCLAEEDPTDSTKINTDNCPLCKAGNQPSVVAAYTVINHSSWTDRKGNAHTDEMNLLVCKTQVAKILRKAMNKKKGLRGWKAEVTRVDDNSPNTGDQFDFEEAFTLDKELVAPNYIEVFAPKTPEELKKVLGEVDANDDVVDF